VSTVEQKSSVVEASGTFIQEKIQTDGAVFVVHRQPIALDRFTVHDIRPSGTAGQTCSLFSLNNILRLPFDRQDDDQRHTIP